MDNYFKDFAAVLARIYERWEKMCHLFSVIMGFSVFVTTVSNERILYRYSNILRSTIFYCWLR
jgi:hypothetical protein